MKEISIWAGIGGSGIADLVDLPRLRKLNLWSSHIDDDGVNQLGRLHNLEVLEYRHDEEHCSGKCQLIGAWPHLRELTVHFGVFDEAELERLTRLSQLESLDLSYTNLWDEALAHLKPLKKLKRLNVLKTELTAEAVAEYENSCPNVSVTGTPAAGWRPFDLRRKKAHRQGSAS